MNQEVKDPLTGAYARGWLMQRLEEDVDLASRQDLELALVVMDIDNFKRVNDAFGHTRGDEILQEMAERLGRATRRSDVLFRYGGDEFVLLLPGTSKEQGLILAERLLEEVRGKVFRGDPPLSLTMSMGLASLKDGVESGEALFDRADRRLLEAKRGGRNQVVWEDPQVRDPFDRSDESRLVEREEALEAGVEFIEGLGERRRGVFIIVGGRQTGKTRFLEEVEKLGGMRGYEVLRVRGDEAKKGRAFGALAGVWQEWGGPELSDAGEEGFEEEVEKVVVKKGKEGLIVGVDEIAQVDRATLRMLAELLGGPKVKRVGVAYTTGPGEWQRAFPVDVALRGAVEMRGWTREGMRIWLRGRMKWEAPEEFVEWLYGETGGVPGHVREGVKHLIGRGVLEKEEEGWDLRRDYRGVALGESLGVIGEGGGHNLPVELTGFVGREKEIQEVRRLLEGGRLLTVVGPAGSGKTRLGVQVGREGVGEYRDGVWFVGLAGLEREDQIVTAVGEALKFSFYGGREAKGQLLDSLRERQLLLILDGVERNEGTVNLVQDILAAAPGVKLVATSRERLKVEGEAVLELEGMEYPEEGTGEEKAEEYGAVQLFLQSARRAKTGFELNERDKREVVRICRLVEGNPRAVERAAAWARVLSCAEIAEEIRRDATFLEEGGGFA